MRKTIIAVYGRGGEGKSTTIKNVITTFQRLYPTVVVHYIIDAGDVMATIIYKGITIGIESRGDPGSRLITEKTVEQLATRYHCDIIVCATRTSGETVMEVDRVAAAHGYYTIWKSSYYTPDLNTTVANEIAAEEIVGIINALLTGRL